MNRDSLLDRILVRGAALFDGWSDAGRWTIALPDPIDEFRVEWGCEDRLEEFLGALRLGGGPGPGSEDIPFRSGWVGFISYEVGSRWEGAPRRDSNPPEPAAAFFRHESGFAISPDGQAFEFGPRGVDRMEAGADAPCEPGGWRGARPSLPRAARSRSKVLSPQRVGTTGRVPRQVPPGEEALGLACSPVLEDSLAGPEYERAHETIRRGIAAGDYYQVNLTRRFSRRVDRRADPRRLYRELAGRKPPAYSALLLGGDFDVVSASPELFLRAEWSTRRAEMRPIKGTAPRFADPDADRRSAEALAGSAKDRAENVMIVDLCRNDLGRVCEPGSVLAADLFRLRSHRLHHLESTVEGRMRAGVSAGDLLRATFPPGSVTGAPKRAAVAAIAGLEPVARGVYTGAVGYVDDRGRLAFNVGIRTAVSTDAEVRYHAGGGITWDSIAELEREESDWKAGEFFALLPSLRRE